MAQKSASFGNTGLPRTAANEGFLASVVKRGLSLLVALNFILLVLAAVSGDLAERSWICALVSRLPVVPFLLPTLLLVLLSVICRQIWLAAFHVGGFVMAFLVLVPFGLPKIKVPFLGTAPEPKSFRVMTYNVGHGTGDAAGVIAAIQNEHPDAFCLQDADTRQPDSPLQVAIREKLGEYNLHIDGGMVIGARHDEIQFTTHQLPQAPEHRPVQDLIVMWNGVKVRVLNVRMNELDVERTLNMPLDHMEAAVVRHADDQAQQMDAILKLVPGFPPLICGDYAQPPRGDNYRQLRKVALDSFAEAGVGLGLTFPSTLPQDRSDFIFMAYGWKASRSWIPRTTASDHFPLVADVYPFLPFE